MKSNQIVKRFCRVFILIVTLNLLFQFPVSASEQTWQVEMLKYLNQLRIEKGLPTVEICNLLNVSAQNFASEMAKYDFLNHRGKGGSTLNSRLSKSGYIPKNIKAAYAFGENIAAGQVSVQSVMDSWKESKGHYQNMVNKTFVHVGFGMAKNVKSKYKIFWVQNFGFGGRCDN